MYVPAYVGARSHHVDCLVAHVLGVRRGETYTHVRRCISHHGKEQRESDLAPIGAFIAIAVDILPEERRLPEPSLAQVGKLGENAFRLSRTFAPAGIWHYAVGAEIVAPAHDAYEARHLIAGDACRDDVAIGLSGA